MNEEYKEKLLKHYEYLTTTIQTLERVIDTIKDSNTLDHDTRTKSAAFLEGYMTGLRENSEWLNYLIP